MSVGVGGASCDKRPVDERGTRRGVELIFGKEADTGQLYVVGGCITAQGGRCEAVAGRAGRRLHRVVSG